jgi:hypothetical protein
MRLQPLATCCLASVLLLAAACARGGHSAEEGQEHFAELAAKAERILLASPETDVEAKPGGKFLVEIKQVLRGSGRKGNRARITNAAENAVAYEQGKDYVFLLVKNADDKGWLNLGGAQLAVEDDQVTLLAENKPQARIALEAFEELVATSVSSPESLLPKRDSLAGRWLLAFSEQGGDNYLWLLDLAESAGGYQARIVESSMASSAIKSQRITDSSLHIEFDAEETIFDFKARFDQGIVRGVMTVAQAAVVPARLEPTEVKDLKKHADPRPTFGQAEFVEAMRDDEPFQPLLKFVRRYRESPLALDAYLMLLGLSKENNYTSAQVQKLAEDFVSAAGLWGPLMEQRAHLDVGRALSHNETFPELGLKHLQMAEESFNDQTPPRWVAIGTREKGKLLLATGQEQAGLALLGKARENDPFDPEVTWILAGRARAAGRKAESLALYAELAALPGLEQEAVAVLARGRRPRADQIPSRVAQSLYREVHGDSEGLDAYFTEVYRKVLASLAGAQKPRQRPGNGNRVVLCELFTGGSCAPCVAADMATSILESEFERAQVIVLRYHQHSPAPDPLANEDGTERYLDYDAEGTPALYVNGKPFFAPGGYLSHVREKYRKLKEIIEPYLDERIELGIDLSAKVSGSKVAIKAKATGLNRFPSDVVLRLVLAEDGIVYTTPNGIRVHNMVARAMPGGVEGVEPVKGVLEYAAEVDVARIRSQLARQLARVETKAAAEFDAKPLALRDLNLVAFLQNVDTEEVLQAISVSVPIETANDEAPEPRKPAKQAPKSSKRAASSSK